MKIKQALTALLLPVAFAACQKEKEAPRNVMIEPHAYLQLQKLQYASGVEANFFYDTDSTLKQINYHNGGAAGGIFFKYNNKQLTETGYDGSLNSNTYTYLNGRVTKMLNKWKQGDPPTSYYFEYTYNTDGTVATQKYYHTNEAGTALKAQSTYQYNSEKLVKQITTTQSAGSIITLKIDAYSDEHDVSPLVFIGHDLNEFYTLYNYPVLSRMNRLPAKISTLMKHPGQQEKTDRIDEMKYEISGRKINKQFIKISHPQHPDLVTLDTVMYTY